ncbi:MAG: phage portal protein [Ignavibacteria bacterium RBG_13_36_8]|nr:MAG: phage portal protein [Ignavibacteria bacterium RBG_13_36_8]
MNPIKNYIDKKYVKPAVEKAAAEKRKVGIKRLRNMFDAAVLDRFSLGLNDDYKINPDIRSSIINARKNARSIFRNNPYGGAIRTRTLVHTIGGDGFRLQVRSKYPDGNLDDLANTIIENKFSVWCREDYCTMTKRFSFVRVQWLVFLQLFRDGEFLVRMVQGLPKEKNPFGFSLQLLDPDDIDETYNEELSENRVVIMGVEFNEWKEITGIYVRKKSLYNEIYGNTNFAERQRIDASEIIYDFDPEHPRQARGMTKLSGIIKTVFEVDDWDKSVLRNARATSKKMGFLYRKHLEGPDLSEDENDDDAGTELEGSGEGTDDGKGKKYMDFEDAMIESLPYGWEYQLSDPKFPSEQHTPFLKSMLRKITGWFGYSYNLSAGDLESVSYSSLRGGEIDEGAVINFNQTLFKDSFLVRVYKRWLKYALLYGQLEPLQYALIEKYGEHEWMGPKKPWVDPGKQAEADTMEVERGWSTDIKKAAERGNDYEENLKEQKKAVELKNKYWVKPVGDDSADSKNKKPKNDTDSIDKEADAIDDDDKKDKNLTIIKAG